MAAISTRDRHAIALTDRQNTGPEVDGLVADQEASDDLVDEWGRQSFPASDPPANW